MTNLSFGFFDEVTTCVEKYLQYLARDFRCADMFICTKLACFAASNYESLS